MKDRIFLDTNILIYAYSSDEISKRETVENIIDTSDKLLISTQVINEFINVMNKKKHISFVDLLNAIKELSKYFSISSVTPATIELALTIATRYQYSYFDSLIIASALENKCSILYTEDMHHNQLIENTLTIRNPLKNINQP